jgi:hypothetical protein
VYLWKRKLETLKSLRNLHSLGDLILVKAEEILYSYNIGLSTVHGLKKWKVQLQSFVVSGESVGTFQSDRRCKSKLAQLDKVLYKGTI